MSNLQNYYKKEADNQHEFEDALTFEQFEKEFISQHKLEMIAQEKAEARREAHEQAILNETFNWNIN